MRFERQPRSSFVKIEELVAEQQAKEQRSRLNLGVLGLLIYQDGLGEEYLIMVHNQHLAEDRGKQEAVYNPYCNQPFFERLQPVENRWHTVSGELETGETPRQALIREADEELGLKIKLEQLQFEPVKRFKVEQLRPVKDKPQIKNKPQMEQALFEVVVLKTSITQEQLTTLQQKFGQNLKLVQLNNLASLNGQYPRRPSTEYAMQLLLESLRLNQTGQEISEKQTTKNIPQP